LLVNLIAVVILSVAIPEVWCGAQDYLVWRAASFDRHSDMARLLRRAIPFLLVGAIVNVAVAWSYDWWPDPNIWETTEIAPTDEIWAALARPEWPPCRSGARLTTQIVTVDMRYSDIDRKTPWVGRYATGFPLRSLEFYVAQEPSPPATLWDDITVRGGLVVRKWPFIGLGLTPRWPGFVVNTVLYAAALAVLVLGPRALRRAYRAQRGRCVSCGYDLRHSARGVCPECGAA
jgi:hypothetical protein